MSSNFQSCYLFWELWCPSVRPAKSSLSLSRNLRPRSCAIWGQGQLSFFLILTLDRIFCKTASLALFPGLHWYLDDGSIVAGWTLFTHRLVWFPSPPHVLGTVIRKRTQVTWLAVPVWSSGKGRLCRAHLIGLMGDGRAFCSCSPRGSHRKSNFQSSTPRCSSLAGEYWSVFQSITSMTGDTTRLLERVEDQTTMQTTH